MLRRFINCVVLGLILGLVVSIGITRYENDQYAINNRIAKIQRQQEILLISVDNPLPALIKIALPSVVYVEVPDVKSGSGVIVGEHTVLTAKHVVTDANTITVETVDGKIYKAIDWVVDEDNDCALIFIDSNKVFDYISEFSDSDKLQMGDVVFTIGSPYGKKLFNTATLGIISGLDRNIPYFGTCKQLTSDAASNPGNSGGPVFDIRGKIVGIVVGGSKGADGLSIIISSNVCQELLKNYDYERSHVGTGNLD